jgi:hypothetical protein
MTPRARDARGRYKKAEPPIDPALVAQLGKDRRAVSFITDVPWELTILDRRGWREMLDGKTHADE